VLVFIFFLRFCKFKTKCLKSLKVDKQALDQQVMDKKLMEEMENKRSDAFGIISWLKF
jgi:hypothetical protein